MTRVIKDDTSLVINGSPNSLAFDTLDFLFFLLLVLLFWLKINSSKTKQKMDRIEKIKSNIHRSRWKLDWGSTTLNDWIFIFLLTLIKLLA